jgi:uracil DNA glycosylase
LKSNPEAPNGLVGLVTSLSSCLSQKHTAKVLHHHQQRTSGVLLLMSVITFDRKLNRQAQKFGMRFLYINVIRAHEDKKKHTHTYIYGKIQQLSLRKKKV